MEALAQVDTDTVIKQTNSIVLKHSDNKVCKNRIEMPFKELIIHISKKLMAFAMVLTSKNKDDAWDLIQSTIEDLIKNKEKLMESNHPMAYAKKILSNNFIDNYRKQNTQFIHNKEDTGKNSSYSFDENGYPINSKKERIQEGNYFDKRNSIRKNISIEQNNIEVTNEGFQEQSVAYQEMLDCLESFDETDRTILAMLGAGHSYIEIQEVVGDISMANLRVKANRARIQLANCIGRKL